MLANCFGNVASASDDIGKTLTYRSLAVRLVAIGGHIHSIYSTNKEGEPTRSWDQIDQPLAFPNVAPMGNQQSQEQSHPTRRIPTFQFRVLIIGRANAGKTSILQRVCDTTGSPVIYRGHEEVRGPFFICESGLTAD